MSTLNILNTLKQKKLLSENQLMLLEAKKSNSKNFLESLIAMYEKKAEMYLESCEYRVKKKLKAQEHSSDKHLEALVIQETIVSAYSVYFKNQLVSLIPSLMLLLKNAAPDLLPSVGMNAAPNANHQLIEETKRVFVNYSARSQLFKSVNSDDLKIVFEENKEEASALFPGYLFNAFLKEQKLNEAIAISLNQLELKAASTDFLAYQVGSAPEIVGGTVYEFVFYLGTVINSVNHDPSFSGQYFKHLQKIETQANFAQTIANAYLKEMCSPEKQKLIESLNDKILNSEITKLCIPALSLIGIKMESDFSHIQQKIAAANQVLTQIQTEFDRQNRAIDENLNKSIQKIDKWRQELQEPEVKFYISSPTIHF